MSPHEPIVVLSANGVLPHATVARERQRHSRRGDRYHLACRPLDTANGLEGPWGAEGAGGRVVRVGASEGPIEIVDYEPSWPACYLRERRRLARVLPKVRIRHIGSTAVPGLAAKPVIDMIALVDDLGSSITAVKELAGYELPERFNLGLTHRRFLCYPTSSYRTHHLHLVDNLEEMLWCVRFRDLLRADPKLAEEYVALKRKLAALYKDDRAGYTAAKSSFINDAVSGC